MEGLLSKLKVKPMATVHKKVKIMVGDPKNRPNIEKTKLKLDIEGSDEEIEESDEEDEKEGKKGKKGKKELEPILGPMIIDNTNKKFDRAAFLANLKKDVVKKIEGRDVEEIVSPRGSPPGSPPVSPIPPPKKLKKVNIKNRPTFALADETVKPKRKYTKRITEKPNMTEKVIPVESVNIGTIISRLPPQKQKVDIKVSSYYMNNREIFVNFINGLFKPYADMLLEDTNILTCDNIGKGNETKDLLIHQRIVRDYINLYTPYRGLLLFHGLGSGKTCSSIGIVEGMKNDKRVIIMTPASLQANYITQLKECGDFFYKLNQFWEWKSLLDSPEMLKPLSMVLNLPEEYIAKNKGAWLVDVTKPPNYSSLTLKEKQELDKQIDKMIESKYVFINYNGIRYEKLKTMTNNFKINLFDDAAVVIDEVHNFISRIVNKLSKGSKTKDAISIRFYEMLLSAQNVKIVALSGTPIINYPNEIGILYNILRGYIKTWRLPLSVKSGKLSHEILHDLLETEKNMDYMEYSPSTKILSITRNPFGFENSIKVRDGYVGVYNKKLREKERMERGEPNRYMESGAITDAQFEKKIASLLKSKDIEIDTSKIVIDLYKALPDKLDDFSNMFIDPVTKKMKNEDLFKRRIIGLTSYFRSAQEELMPRYNKLKDFVVVEIFMSDYQFEIYEKARIQERKLEMNAKKSQSKKKGGKEGDIFKEAVSTYRIFSRLFCNFVMPPDVGRPLPNEDQEVEVKGDVEELKEVEDIEKDIEGGGHDSSSDSDSDSDMEEIESEDEEINYNLTDDDIYENHDKGVHDMDDIYKARGDDDLDIIQLNPKKKKEPKEKVAKIPKEPKEKVAKIPKEPKEKVAKIPKEPKEKVAKIPKEPKEKVAKIPKEPKEKAVRGFENVVKQMERTEDLDLDDNTVGELEADENLLRMGGLTYENRIKESMNQLITHSSEYLTPEPLKTYSPKFLHILENILEPDNVGLHLVYSQFRTLEGIGIFSEVLIANGFTQFKIKKSTRGWDMDIPESEFGNPMFALYTGTESAEEKEIVRKIYNGEWNDTGFPSLISSKLNELSNDNNLGEIIKVFMITASGSEGINLRNTRFVHIMEPYWHPTRIEQVVGRARRICSHQQLPEELQTVQVFLYLMKFTKEQVDMSKELKKNDVSKLPPKTNVTSDQALYEINIIKTQVTQQILKSIKEASIDCNVHSKSDTDEDVVCMSFGSNPSKEEYSYVPSIEKESGDVISKVNKKVVKWKAKEFPIQGVIYAYKEDTQELYDYNSYLRGAPILLGTAIKKGNDYVIQFV
jgi:hypothetical protein